MTSHLPHSQTQIRAQVRRVLILTLILNIMVATTKIVLGAVTGALAIAADGFHSLTDGAGNVAGLIANWFASQPPDADHPYGHRRYETLAALLIGGLLLLTAWEVVKGAVERLQDPVLPTLDAMTFGIMLVALGVNIFVTLYEQHHGKRLRSEILLADSRHTRVDVWVTISVIISLGIMQWTGWAWLDAVMALAIVVLIGRAGWQIVTETGRVLVDTAPYSGEALRDILGDVPNVQHVLRVRSRGTEDAAHIDIDVEVAPAMTTAQNEDVAQTIRQRLTGALVGISEVEVHFMPSTPIPPDDEALATAHTTTTNHLAPGELNLPHLAGIPQAQNILIAGMGGGYDIFGGLPLYFALREQGKQVHLANYTFTDPHQIKDASSPQIAIPDILIGTQGRVRRPVAYYPEGYLTEWFLTSRGEDVPVWMIARLGVQPVRMAFQHLVTTLDIDAIILVDGGVDSLMHGDESAPGTLTEDSITLGAVRHLGLPMIQACIGFGTEVEENVNHYRALENMAKLITDGAFYGSCALTPHMSAYQAYATACRYVFDKQPKGLSHIHTRVIPSVEGRFGHQSMYDDAKPDPALISPLMGIYWFFDSHAVIKRNQLLDLLEDTHLSQEAFQRVLHHMTNSQASARPSKPLPY